MQCNYRVLLILLGCSSALLPIYAKDSNQQKLSSITSEIHSLEAGIAHDQDSQKGLQSDLQTTEIKMSHLILSVTKLSTEMTSLQKSINQLNTQINQLQDNLSGQESNLKDEIHNTYQFGQDGAVKLILNTESPDDLQRMMHYFRILNQQKLAQMKTIKANLDHLLQLQNHLQQKKVQLQNIQQQQQDLLHDLRAQQMAREKLIAAIDDSLSVKNDRLRTLQQNRQSLETLVQQLKRQPIITTPPPLGFAKLQGHLPWPLNGTIAEHFGASIEDSNLQSSGVLINTPENTPVHAIYPGRVIFADWLKGFGLLVIIDHGQNYMSLYGRNDALMVKTGDTVGWGQIIAKAGSTGGYNKSSLYFEIRHQGEPINPERWCQG